MTESRDSEKEISVVKTNERSQFDVKRAFLGTIVGFLSGWILFAALCPFFGLDGFGLLGCIIGAPVGLVLGPRLSGKQALLGLGIMLGLLICILIVFILRALIVVIMLLLMAPFFTITAVMLKFIPPWAALLIAIMVGAAMGWILSTVNERWVWTKDRTGRRFFIATSFRRKIMTVCCVVLLTLGFVLLWCKTDGSMTIKEYRPTFWQMRSPVVHDLYAYPCLESKGSITRKPGILFKEIVTYWPGPYRVTITLKDFGKIHQKARLTGCKIGTADGTWSEILVDSGLTEGWQQSFKNTTDNNDCTVAEFWVEPPESKQQPVVSNSVPPADVKGIVLETTFDLECDGVTESIKKTYTLKQVPDSYSSYGFNSAIAM